MQYILNISTLFTKNSNSQEDEIYDRHAEMTFSFSPGLSDHVDTKDIKDTTKEHKGPKHRPSPDISPGFIICLTSYTECNKC